MLSQPRRSEGDISRFRPRKSHQPLTGCKSVPIKPSKREDTANVFGGRIFHDTVGSLAEYEKEVEEAARKMEVIIMKERQAIQDFEKKLGEGESKKKMGTLTRWITLKRKTDKNNQAAKEDMKRAAEAMKAAEDKITSIEDILEEEEKQLQARAIALRRKSEDIFKLVDHKSLLAKSELNSKNQLRPEYLTENFTEAKDNFHQKRMNRYSLCLEPENCKTGFETGSLTPKPTKRVLEVTAL